MKRKCIIGLGSPLYHDDGIGIYLLEKLREHESKELRDFNFIDGGNGGFTLLHVLEKYDFIMILDAVNFDYPPSTLKIFTPDEVKSLRLNNSISTHHQDFLRVIDIAEKINQNHPNLLIAGIQPEDLSFGEGLSDSLKNNIQKIIKELIVFITRQ